MQYIDPYLNYIIVAVVIISALVLLTMTTRAFSGRVRGRKGKRLGVSEYREIDQSRRLMLVRRDDVEHLIMVGGGQSLVIEQNIIQGDDMDYASPPVAHHRQPPQLVDDNIPEFDPEPIHSPAPRAPSFGDRAPNVRPIQRDAPRFDDNDKY